MATKTISWRNCLNMQIRCGWCSYCFILWNFDYQCFWDAHLLYYSTSVYNYGGTFVQVTNWALSQVCVGTDLLCLQSSTPEWYTTPFWYTFVYLIASPNHHHFFSNNMFWLHIHTNKSSTKFQVDWTSSGSTVKCSNVCLVDFAENTLTPQWYTQGARSRKCRNTQLPHPCTHQHPNLDESGLLWFRNLV